MKDISRRSAVLLGTGTAASVFATAAQATPRSGAASMKPILRVDLIDRSWTSPFAAAQRTWQGRLVKNLAAHEGRIYIGYGDWNANAGPMHIHYIDAATGAMSGSLLKVPGEAIHSMKVVGGALYAPNIDPRTPWGSSSPFASNASGTWKMSGRTNAVHVFDVESVPGQPGAIMASGSQVNVATGEVSHGTWLTVDGGLSFRSFMGPGSNPHSRVFRMINVKGALYAFTASGAWRWRGVLPTSRHNDWGTGWEAVSLPGPTDALALDVPVSSNGRFAAWSLGSTFVFDGATIRVLDGDVAGMQAFSPGDDGFLYGLNTVVGIVRTRDGVSWQKLANPGVWGDGGFLPSSLAVSNETIFCGGMDGIVKAVASTRGTWSRAKTSDSQLDEFNLGVATQASSAEIQARLGQHPRARRLFCSGSESPAKHIRYVNDECYPNGILPVISVKNATDAAIISSIRAMSGPGLLIVHHEPFPQEGAGFGPDAPEPGVWADMQVNAATVLIPAINQARPSEDRWAVAGAFHGFAFKYNPATGAITYAKKFRDLGGPAAYRLSEVFALPGYIPGVDAYDSGANPTVAPLGGAEGPAERMEALYRFCTDVVGLDPEGLRIAFPEFGTYAGQNYQRACDWLAAHRDLVVAACSWDHAQNDNGGDTSLTGTKLSAFQSLLESA